MRLQLTLSWSKQGQFWLVGLWSFLTHHYRLQLRVKSLKNDQYEPWDSLEEMAFQFIRCVGGCHDYDNVVVFFVGNTGWPDPIWEILPFLVSWILVSHWLYIPETAAEGPIRGWLIPISIMATYLAILIASTMFSYFHLDNCGSLALNWLHLFVFGLSQPFAALKRGNI